MIYLLEDDDSIRELICYSLAKTGNEALGFALPSAFFAAVNSQIPDLVILDVMLPEEDGISVLCKLRADSRTAELPIIMLTARDSEFDKVVALDAGADDYVTKPFGVMELMSRIKALLRRSGTRSATVEEKNYTVGPLSVSTIRHEAYCNGEPIFLTYKEFELLCFLLENRGAVLNRDQILKAVWGYEFDGENRTVDVHVRSLRRKLGEACDVIETVRGVGYKIAARR